MDGVSSLFGLVKLDQIRKEESLDEDSVELN